MQRWLEEWEDYPRFQEITRGVGESCSPGHVAYAWKTAGMFSRMEVEARNSFMTAGYGHLLQKSEDKKWTLSTFIQDERTKISAALERPLFK